eukprot:1153376-Pelagomonas_calceolata.AAC.2
MKASTAGNGVLPGTPSQQGPVSPSCCLSSSAKMRSANAAFHGKCIRFLRSLPNVKAVCAAGPQA